MSEEVKNIKSRTVWSLMSLFFNSGYSAFLGLIANLIVTILFVAQKRYISEFI